MKYAVIILAALMMSGCAALGTVQQQLAEFRCESPLEQRLLERSVADANAEANGGAKVHIHCVGDPQY